MEVQTELTKSSQAVAFARDIKLEHSLFALPFAFIGALSAVHYGTGTITLRLAGFILVAMFFARTAAMGFNRYLDADIDKKTQEQQDVLFPLAWYREGLCWLL
ncbi:MAG: hypothetical protein JKX97_04380 [Candidatus Lindowbacteria bacterium]|nr:hypothetical protein [Candidatus Lindowbacteria bacterium]